MWGPVGGGAAAGSMIVSNEMIRRNEMAKGCITEVTCAVCGIKFVGNEDNGDGLSGCGMCRSRYPKALIKACSDEFTYALGLVSGAVIVFGSAEINGDWVHLSDIDDNFTTLANPSNYCVFMDRGIDIQISHILWVVDAPNG